MDTFNLELALTGLILLATDFFMQFFLLVTVFVIQIVSQNRAGRTIHCNNNKITLKTTISVKGSSPHKQKAVNVSVDQPLEGSPLIENVELLAQEISRLLADITLLEANGCSDQSADRSESGTVIQEEEDLNQEVALLNAYLALLKERVNRLTREVDVNADKRPNASTDPAPVPEADLIPTRNPSAT